MGVGKANNPQELRKGVWTKEEDFLLIKCMEKYGEGKWHQVPSRAGLNRCRKSCRLRWLNYLRPNIKRGDFTEDEIDLILRLHKLIGNRWSLIAGRIPGRTANDIKNYWNTHLQKKLVEKREAMKEQKKTDKPLATPKRPDSETADNNNNNSNNVVKPRPRTFPKASTDITSKGITTNADHDDCIKIDQNPISPVTSSNDESGLNSSSSSCAKWWKNLLTEADQENNYGSCSDLSVVRGSQYEIIEESTDITPDGKERGGWGSDELLCDLDMEFWGVFMTSDNYSIMDFDS